MGCPGQSGVPIPASVQKRVEVALGDTVVTMVVLQSSRPTGWRFSPSIPTCGERGEGGEAAPAGPGCSKPKQENISALIASRLLEDECQAGGFIISGH